MEGNTSFSSFPKEDVDFHSNSSDDSRGGIDNADGLVLSSNKSNHEKQKMLWLSSEAGSKNTVSFPRSYDGSNNPN